jgi:Tfp pilus assembly protein PilV
LVILLTKYMSKPTLIILTWMTTPGELSRYLCHDNISDTLQGKAACRAGKTQTDKVVSSVL